MAPQLIPLKITQRLLPVPSKMPNYLNIAKATEVYCTSFAASFLQDNINTYMNSISFDSGYLFIISLWPKGSFLFHGMPLLLAPQSPLSRREICSSRMGRENFWLAHELIYLSCPVLAGWPTSYDQRMGYNRLPPEMGIILESHVAQQFVSKFLCIYICCCV